MALFKKKWRPLACRARTIYFFHEHNPARWQLHVIKWHLEVTKPKVRRQNPSLNPITFANYQQRLPSLLNILTIQLGSPAGHFYLPFFTQSVSSNFCGHTLLIKGTKFSFIVHFNEFLAASGRERDVQLKIKRGEKNFMNIAEPLQRLFHCKKPFLSPTHN